MPKLAKFFITVCFILVLTGSAFSISKNFKPFPKVELDPKVLIETDLFKYGVRDFSIDFTYNEVDAVNACDIKDKRNGVKKENVSVIVYFSGSEIVTTTLIVTTIEFKEEVYSYKSWSISDETGDEVPDVVVTNFSTRSKNNCSIIGKANVKKHRDINKQDKKYFYLMVRGILETYKNQQGPKV